MTRRTLSVCFVLIRFFVFFNMCFGTLGMDPGIGPDDISVVRVLEVLAHEGHDPPGLGGEHADWELVQAGLLAVLLVVAVTEFHVAVVGLQFVVG